MEYHTGLIAKPFVCDVCGKGFRINANLVVCLHLLFHFLLLENFLYFYILNVIQEHRRIHTGEKPFNCEYCGLNFRTMSSYYSHLKKIHGLSTNYTCLFHT